MKILSFLFIVLFYSLQTFAIDQKADSLKRLLDGAKTQQERISRCLDLDNYYCNVLFIDSLPITRMLLNEGIKAKNEYVISDALRKLVMGVDRKERLLTHDSIIYYLGVADRELKGERKQSFITEVHLRHIRSIAEWGADENEIIEELTTKYTNSNQPNSDIYFEIEKNYALGMATALGFSDGSSDGFKKTLPYFDRLFELIRELPVEYGAEILFCVNESIYLGYVNARDNVGAMSFLEKMMDVLDRYKKLPNVKSDTYQTFPYISSLYHEGSAYFPTIVGYEKSLESLKKSDKMMRARGDLITLYFTYKGFYEDLQDHKMIIIYADSIVEFMKTYDSPMAETVISESYKDQAKSYAALKKYKTAYELMFEHDILQNKINNTESEKLRAEMIARYDLNHLELEKEQLTSRNRKFAFISLSLFFILSIAWGFTQRYHLNRLKRMQKKLMESNIEVVRQSEKAKESEKMKDAFISSMCHEIRTPLNAINGFSSLLLDESVDAQDKEEFPELIQSNTTLLTMLLDNLLEVSNLSSSTEKFQMEQVDIRAVCTQEFEKLRSVEGKDSIQYKLDIADNCNSVRTNSYYLSRAISHLLSNSNKFTASGEIAIKCRWNENNELEIRVIDTGIGIDIDKQESIFERFVKLDDFKQGAGLGLYVCRLIVSRLGGTICVDSTYTSGASFVITLHSVLLANNS